MNPPIDLELQPVAPRDLLLFLDAMIELYSQRKTLAKDHAQTYNAQYFLHRYQSCRDYISACYNTTEAITGEGEGV